MNVYSFCSSQSMGLLARSRPSPDVLLSTTASKGSSCPWILNAQISPAEGESTVRRSVGNLQAEDSASAGPDLQGPNFYLISSIHSESSRLNLWRSALHVHFIKKKKYESVTCMGMSPSRSLCRLCMRSVFSQFLASLEDFPLLCAQSGIKQLANS